MPGGKPLWGQSLNYGGANLQNATIQGMTRLLNGQTSHDVVQNGFIVTPSVVQQNIAASARSAGQDGAGEYSVVESEHPALLSLWRRLEAARTQGLKDAGYDDLIAVVNQFDDAIAKIQKKIDNPRGPLDIVLEGLEILGGIATLNPGLISKAVVGEIDAAAKAGDLETAKRQLIERGSVYRIRANEIYAQFPERMPVGVWRSWYVHGQEASYRDPRTGVYTAVPLRREYGTYEGARELIAMLFGLI